MQRHVTLHVHATRALLPLTQIMLLLTQNIFQIQFEAKIDAIIVDDVSLISSTASVPRITSSETIV